MNKNFMNMMEQQSGESSDEENRPKTSNKSRMTKKQQREADQNLREGYGVGNQKESSQRGNQRGFYQSRPQRGREKDRQSGTGRQAFGGSSKRGGYGKGNVGTLKDQIDEAKKGDQTLKQDDVPQPEPVKEEKIVDLDEYMKETGMNLQITDKNKEELELHDPKMFEDENTVAVTQKKKTVPEKRKNRGNDGVSLGDTIVSGKWKPQRRKKKKVKKTKLTEDDFPALS